jgi:hypothetical protein
MLNRKAVVCAQSILWGVATLRVWSGFGIGKACGCFLLRLAVALLPFASCIALLLARPLSSTIRLHRHIGTRAANHPLNIDSFHCRNNISRTSTISPGPTFLILLPPQGDHTCLPTS